MNLLKDYRLIPVEETEEYIKLLAPEGYDPLVLEEIRFITNKDLRVTFLSQEEFTQQLQRVLSQQEIQIEGYDTEREVTDLLLEESSGPAVDFVNQLLIKGATTGASDIHIEPYEGQSYVRIRLDGVLHDYVQIPLSLHQQVVARIKVLADLNVAERRTPQDGKMRVRVGGKDIDIRVSVIPTVFGERVVLRLLYRSEKILSLEELGLSQEDLAKLKRAAKKPYGMILATGPTGAGKSTTLYALLLEVKNPTRNIITIEDPPEYQLEGVSQIQVNPKVGLTFAAGLRAILRQDPDVIMVGEIRDSETAQIAVHAALTGHLLLSTLHTNDAPSSISRLVDLGVEPFLLASSLDVVIAQRLVRKICNQCKEPYEPTEEELRELSLEGHYTFYRGKGCPACMGTGYRGRTGIFEILELTEDLKKLIVRTQDAQAIREEAVRRGFRSMLEDGVRKVMEGITTPEEIIRAVRTEA
ncbi:type II secretion system protein E [Thermocrinis albus DSM 14484]|uniref:Type II secretion system protein E n=1 Tax=Thermocrinis albus (strain DSM 14484 / JCM 11386 / HI 11/12) TaxID=638303 RepID=D3SMA7_THEAH|nr:GspE/PulE family protein [Thermocrinis albus]ADC89887.1 type II secretion system protein E [Thermocrinis albus DSM 14484]